MLYSVKIYSGGWLSGRKFPSFGGVPVRAGWFFRIHYFLELGCRLVICNFLFFSWSEFLLRFWSVGEPPRPLRGHPSGGGELRLLSSATAFSSRKRGIGTFEFCDNFGGGKFGLLYSVKIYSGGWLSGRKFPSFGGVPVRAGWFFRIHYFLELGCRLVICSFLFFSWSEFFVRFWSVGRTTPSATRPPLRRRGIGNLVFEKYIPG